MTNDELGDGEPAPELQAVLAALDDPDCRTLMQALTTPMTAQELMEECELSQTTTYRKLEMLNEAALVREGTMIRDDGHHTTQYHRVFAGVAIWLTEEDFFDVTMIRQSESPDERLARFWTQMSETL